jgi:hypothetical protein
MSSSQLRKMRQHRQLLLMLLGQVILLSLLISLNAAQKIYTTFDYKTN